jgi:putative oxidoreductase
MFKKLVQTEQDYSLMISRLVLGVIFFAHRSQLMLGWFGAQKGEGFECHLLAIALGLVVVLRGSGALSLDRLLFKSSESAPAVAGDLEAIS